MILKEMKKLLFLHPNLNKFENPRIGENEHRPSNVNRVNLDDIENSLELDPGKWIPIWYLTIDFIDYVV